MLRDVTFADIVPGYRSDHNIVTLDIKKGEREKKRQYWKFNNSFNIT